VFVDADYVTLELRTLAEVCRAQLGLGSQMAALLNAGRDLHRVVAAQITGKAEGEVSQEERSAAKAVNFGRPGGMSNASIARYAKMKFRVQLTEQQVAELSQAWFQLFPEMREFLRSDNSGQAGVFTLTGRLRANADWCARRNTLFQGLAADGAKMALWRLWRAGYHIVAFVHDQVLVELPASCDLAAHAQKIHELMIQGMNDVIPDIRVDVTSKIRQRW
jgi:DNA polymerase-1